MSGAERGDRGNGQTLFSRAAIGDGGDATRAGQASLTNQGGSKEGGVVAFK